MPFVELSTKGDRLIVRAPYLKVFVDELKRVVPARERKFESSSKSWIITLNNKSLVEGLVAKYFSELEEALLVAISKDTPPRFGGEEIVRFSRDWYRGVSSDLVHVVKAVRVGDTGSRRKPLWSGYVLARVFVNPNIPIEAKHYRLFRFSPGALEKLQDFVEQLADKYGDELDRATEELENLDAEAINIKANVRETVLETLSEHISELEKLEYAAQRDRKTHRAEQDSLRRILQRVEKSLEYELKRVKNLLERIS